MEQAGAVEELTATVEDISTMAENNAKDVESAYQKIVAAEKEADQSQRNLFELIDAMQGISDTSLGAPCDCNLMIAIAVFLGKEGKAGLVIGYFALTVLLDGVAWIQGLWICIFKKMYKKTFIVLLSPIVIFFLIFVVGLIPYDETAGVHADGISKVYRIALNRL